MGSIHGMVPVGAGVGAVPGALVSDGAGASDGAAAGIAPTMAVIGVGVLPITAVGSVGLMHITVGVGADIITRVPL